MNFFLQWCWLSSTNSFAKSVSLKKGFMVQVGVRASPVLVLVYSGSSSSCFKAMFFLRVLASICGSIKGFTWPRRELYSAISASYIGVSVMSVPFQRDSSDKQNTGLREGQETQLRIPCPIAPYPCVTSDELRYLVSDVSRHDTHVG